MQKAQKSEQTDKLWKKRRNRKIEYTPAYDGKVEYFTVIKVFNIANTENVDKLLVILFKIR